MDDSLYFTEHHHQVREMVRDFSRTHIAPVAAELDRTSTFSVGKHQSHGRARPARRSLER